MRSLDHLSRSCEAKDHRNQRNQSVTEGPTDGPTYRRTDGLTKRGVESCSKRLKSHYGMVTLIHKSFIFNLFAYEIKFRQDQILHFKLSESRSHLRYIKEQQSILACFMTSKGSQFKFDSAGSLTSKVLILLSNCGFFVSHSHSARFRLYSL